MPHIEAVIAGSAADVGLPANVGGVSPFTVDCGTIQNSIVFAFAPEYGTDYQTVCEVAAQEIAHSFGLDHEVLASDPMTYLSFNGHKTFQDQTASCGETNGPRQCGLVLQGYPSCRANQNSVQLLLQRVGPAGTADTAPPNVSITSPSNGATVRPGFAVDVSASDNVGVTKVELYVDGALADTKTAAPFSFTTSSSLSNGAHTIETRAYDASNTTRRRSTSQSIRARPAAAAAMARATARATVRAAAPTTAVTSSAAVARAAARPCRSRPGSSSVCGSGAAVADSSVALA